MILRLLHSSTVAGEDVLQIVSRIPGRALGSLVMAFANCGICGVAILLFGYGEAGFTFGVVFMPMSSPRGRPADRRLKPRSLPSSRGASRRCLASGGLLRSALIVAR